MRSVLLIGLLSSVLASSSVAVASDAKQSTVYRGTWLTTNRKLDGTMTCKVTELGGNRWRGHFYGVWYGQEFSYKVDFTGPVEKLKGKAFIDGADYEWTGSISKDNFKGTFWGSRYRGRFSLEQQSKGK